LLERIKCLAKGVKILDLGLVAAWDVSSPREIVRVFRQQFARLLIAFALCFCLQYVLANGRAEITSGVPGYVVTRTDFKPTPSSVPPAARQPAKESGSLTVLILGDSLSLCGFGERLDMMFRNDARIKSTYTYMACGTVPASWLKRKPFANAKTYCGFWSIESVPGAAKPREFQDTYGIERGGRPKPHAVPKLEDLLATLQPDILVIQTGNNLLSNFRDGKSVVPAQHGPMMKGLIAPFIYEALKPPSSVRKLYWVASPVSGRVSKEVQDFVIEQVRSLSAGAVTVIDSRQLLSYPYQHMAPDREHFFGAQMNQWEEAVFKIIAKDLESQPLSNPRLATDSPDVNPEPANPVKKGTDDVLSVMGTLTFKSQPLRIDQLLPYQESLVAYIYDVQEVLKGKYKEKQILVMHPAHIGLEIQTLNKYEVGKSYDLHLHELEGTQWSTVKSRDDSDRIDLVPYIRVEDEIRFPAQADPL
jgi:hypothetical protein